MPTKQELINKLSDAEYQAYASTRRLTILAHAQIQGLDETLKLLEFKEDWMQSYKRGIIYQLESALSVLKED